MRRPPDLGSWPGALKKKPRLLGHYRGFSSAFRVLGRLRGTNVIQFITTGRRALWLRCKEATKRSLGATRGEGWMIWTAGVLPAAVG